MASKKKSAKKEAPAASAGVRTIAGTEHDISNYRVVKNANGATSRDSGDEVAVMLEGKTLDEVYTIAAKRTKNEEKELRSRFKHLNPGMQRMNLGNMIRRVLREKAAA